MAIIQKRGNNVQEELNKWKNETVPLAKYINDKTYRYYAIQPEIYSRSDLVVSLMNDEQNVILLSASLYGITDKEKKITMPPNRPCEIGCYIVFLISDDNSYIWVYHVRSEKKDSLLLTYYCNCRVDLKKQPTKHLLLDNQKDMPSYLKWYHFQQIYHWWSIKTCKKYFCDSNQLLSSVLLLVEFNQEIIIDLDAIEIDATYRTNNMECELYTIMGVLDGTGFPLSYLLISARKGQNITDFAEINAAQTNVYYSYNPKIAHKECSVINPNWRVTNNSERVFCPLNFWETVIKLVQRNGNYPLISIYEGEFVNIFHSLNSKALNISGNRNLVIENNDNYIVESDDKQHIYETDLAYLCGILDKTKELLEKSCNKPKCHLWLKNIRPNFKLLEKMNDDIRALKNRQITPRPGEI
ncbi:hypothetical protein RhiirA1_450493 [Rhizophagus irregularis]|uniref:MULE transposase domain-containing protein n=1 Tax=Rhizophagus irregularis TaxID=588596 RepID=A0A2N0SEK8_9GLOM|nr:hypothetical protein RhiirA1_450493 [Rhizophagus irregularis]